MNNPHLRPEERAFLQSQFGNARITLLQRSPLEQSLCLLQWEGTRRPALTPVFGGGPSTCWYVLDLRNGPALHTVSGPRELEERWRGMFAPLPAPHRGVWEVVLDGLRRPRPWHIVAVIGTWLLVAIFVAAWIATGHRL